MSELEKILALVEELELEMVEEGVYLGEGYYANKIGEIKEMLYNESAKQISKAVDTGAGFQGGSTGDGLSGFRG